MKKEYQKMIVITAPSGAGKTSITRYLMKMYPQLSFSISAATRQPRANEKNGKDYHFISVEDFQKKILNEEFVEWEMVYQGKYYGTLKTELERIWSNEKIPVLDIDVQGAIHVQKEYPVNSLFIFIKPPSIQELQKRLESRGSESKDSLETRINKAAYELSFADQFTHVIENNDFKTACNEASKIVNDFLNN
ncbi:MAG TPA: guanylate kinase [Chitinophagaceae bacterium]|nr:guanylate kinase [Chitinophagaceae bacterium]